MDLFIRRQQGREGGEALRPHTPKESRVPPSLPRRVSPQRVGGISGYGSAPEQRAVQSWGTSFDAWAMLAAVLLACRGLPRHPAEKTSGEGTLSASVFQECCPGAGRMPEFGMGVARLKGQFDYSITSKSGTSGGVPSLLNGPGCPRRLCARRDMRPRSQGVLLPVQAAWKGVPQLCGMSPLASRGGRDAK